MRIGLVAVDGHNNFPNLALMKLSAWHKAQGDLVEWAVPMFGSYDRVYLSKVFTFTPDDYTPWNCEVIKAGTGYGDYSTQLTPDQEHICPDYSLYPDFDAALGFTTRGCVRKCPWCIVPVKEGRIHIHAQPYKDFAGKVQTPQWQKDLAHWCNKRMLYKGVDLYAFSPRKGFTFGKYL